MLTPDKSKMRQPTPWIKYRWVYFLLMSLLNHKCKHGIGCTMIPGVKCEFITQSDFSEKKET